MSQWSTVILVLFLVNAQVVIAIVVPLVLFGLVIALLIAACCVVKYGSIVGYSQYMILLTVPVPLLLKYIYIESIHLFSAMICAMFITCKLLL